VDELTDDAIAGSWRIYQRRRGHRYSIDDVATAEAAVRAKPDAERYLDLGCGIGSVLLMVAYKLRRAQITGIEAQRISFELAQRNVARNGVEAELRHGDLRALEGGAFDLITGTPPYQKPGTASPSTDEQRTYARIEMRGGVEDYLRAASRVLSLSGRAVVCCDARTPERAIEGGRAVGLAWIRRRDVVPRAAHKGALFTVWTFAREDDASAPIEDAPLYARDANGARTEDAHALRRFFDLAINTAEAASP
jgi:tRNA1Val (adenine37-N6)-methyltransferase